MQIGYFHIICKEKISIFWLTEDIKDFIPEAICEFLDGKL